MLVSPRSRMRSAVAATLLAACSVLTPAQEVVPSLALQTQHLGNATSSSRFLLVTDTSERELGSIRESTVLTSHDGKPALLSVRTVTTQRGAVLDSALAYHRTLAPIWQHSHQPTKTMLLEFSASGVTGNFTPKDSATRAVHHPLSERVFDTTDLDEVISSLPFANGYSAVLPFYTFEEGAVERDSIRVVGVEKIAAPDKQMRSAWKVSFVDPVITSTYWIDQQTRKVLRQDIVQRRSGIRFRIVPLT